MWATDHSRWSVTIATIPPAAVDRIEVLNDGGSAPNVVPNAGSYFDATGNQYTLIPGTRGIATASDFIINGGSNRDFNLLYQQLIPRETRYGASFMCGESDGSQIINNNFTTAALNGTLAGHVGQFFNPFVDESVAGDPSRAFYNGADFQDPGKLASGRRYIHSTFGEVDIPILGQKWSWPGLRNLDVTLSERYDQYSDFSAAKPKFAIRYKPFNDLTFRATYSEGFSAPSLATQSDDSSTFR